MEEKDWSVDALVNITITVSAYSEYGAEVKAKEALSCLLSDPDVGYYINIIEANGTYEDNNFWRTNK